MEKPVFTFLTLISMAHSTSCMFNIPSSVRKHYLWHPFYGTLFVFPYFPFMALLFQIDISSFRCSCLLVWHMHTRHFKFTNLLEALYFYLVNSLKFDKLLGFIQKKYVDIELGRSTVEGPKNKYNQWSPDKIVYLGGDCFWLVG